MSKEDEEKPARKKPQRTVSSYVSREMIAEKMRQEEEEWAKKCGPVTVRKIGDPK